MASRYPVTTTNCRLCGIEFPSKPSRLKRSTLNFCSDKCLRKKNTLHGWIVRCNREFQKRCAPKPLTDEWVSLLRGFERTEWVNRNSGAEHKKWNAKLNSMMGANRHREAISQQKSKVEPKEITWETSLYLMLRTRSAKTAWDKKLANWLTNQQKRMRTKSVSRQCDKN